MKAIWKGFIAGIVLILIGAAIIVATLATNGWSSDKEFSMKTYVAENDNSSLVLDVGAGNLRTEFYDGDRIEISYPEAKRFSADIKETDGTLTYSTKLKWYAGIFNFGKLNAATVIRLPQGKAFDLKMDVGAGTVTVAGGDYGNVCIDLHAGTLIADGISCNNLNCDINAGTFKANDVSCSKLKCDINAGKLELASLTCPDIKADVSAGTLKIGVNGVKSDYTIRAEVSAGSCNVSNQTGSTDKKLDVDCSAGTISVNFNG